jgi:hypothetical protein
VGLGWREAALVCAFLTSCNTCGGRSHSLLHQLWLGMSSEHDSAGWSGFPFLGLHECILTRGKSGRAAQGRTQSCGISGEVAGVWPGRKTKNGWFRNPVPVPEHRRTIEVNGRPRSKQDQRGETRRSMGSSTDLPSWLRASRDQRTPLWRWPILETGRELHIHGSRMSLVLERERLRSDPRVY